MSQSSPTAPRTLRPGWPAGAAGTAGRPCFGWLVFVILAFLIGNMIGSNKISAVDQFSGESGRAEKARDRAGLRPIAEVVFVRSDTLTVDDPEFRAAIEDVTQRLSRVPYVENIDRR